MKTFSVKHEAMVKGKPQQVSGGSKLPAKVFEPLSYATMVRTLEINNEIIDSAKSTDTIAVIRANVGRKLTLEFTEHVAGGAFLRLCALLFILRNRNESGSVTAAELMAAAKTPLRKKNMTFAVDAFKAMASSVEDKFDAAGKLLTPESAIAGCK